MDPREQLRRDLLRGPITEPLLSEIQAAPEATHAIIIACNESIPSARAHLQTQLPNAHATGPYLVAHLTGQAVFDLATHPAIYRIWKDEQVRPCLTHSRATIKADAAERAFNTTGQGITWAVLDSGIDRTHPHFAHHANIPDNTWHEDFTGGGNPFDDAYGHGTHVAGIVAGHWTNPTNEPVAVAEILKPTNADNLDIATQPVQIATISGVAPATQLISMRVLDAQGRGRVSNVLRAIEKIQLINDHGRRLALPNAAIHGVNLSLGYDFNPRWFGCGHSPLCTEVNRLVRSGVVVVVAAGNDGFNALSRTDSGAPILGYHLASINDPGNADLAITVGATHRDQPHTYGVSYFSSRGPTGDGRRKPDLVAPGEHIMSCAAGTSCATSDPSILYREQSGTSMAAPHVSGAIAAFLSVRREFIGQPEAVKQLFLNNATDLHREPNSQGRGLLDLMRALQAV